MNYFLPLVIQAQELSLKTIEFVIRKLNSYKPIKQGSMKDKTKSSYESCLMGEKVFLEGSVREIMPVFLSLHRLLSLEICRTLCRKGC